MRRWSATSRNFATRNGAGVVELLRLTGFRSLSEFHEETSVFERHLIIESIEAYNEERSSTGGGGGGGMTGPPGL